MTINMNDQQNINIIRAALIRARYYCYSAAAEYGSADDENKTPDQELKTAFDIFGMIWEADIMEILHGDEWNGNEQFKPIKG